MAVNGQKLAAVDKFTYLGSTLSRSVHIDDETDARIVKARVAFGRLRSSALESKGVSLATKLSVYRAIVSLQKQTPHFLRGVCFWRLSHCPHHSIVCQRGLDCLPEARAKKLDRFHLNCLRKLLKVKWQDKVPDTEIL